MSFELVDSDNIYCTAHSGIAGKGFYNNRVCVGDYEIEIGDFCALVLYVFTNTDLDDTDIRKQYAKRIGSLVEVDGFNRGNKRLEEAQQVIQPDNAQ